MIIKKKKKKWKNVIEVSTLYTLSFKKKDSCTIEEFENYYNRPWPEPNSPFCADLAKNSTLGPSQAHRNRVR